MKTPHLKAKRIPLQPFAYGEVTGHMHAVCEQDENRAEMYEFEGALVVVPREGAIRIVHGRDRSNLAPPAEGEDRHGPLLLDRSHPTQQRQGDVLFTPIPGWEGAWKSTIQTEETPDAIIRQVAD